MKISLEVDQYAREFGIVLLVNCHYDSQVKCLLPSWGVIYLINIWPNISCHNAVVQNHESYLTITMTMKICLLPQIYIYTRYRMQDINTLSLALSMLKGHETEAHGPQFLLYNRKHFILGCKRQEMVQNERRMTSFIIDLKSRVLLMHGQERV